nr:polysaccharide biosynthesis C-terminal domain-containing protein [Thermosipho sp. 1244]
MFIFSEKYLASVPYFRIYQTILYFRIYVYGSIFVATKNSRIFLFNAIYSLIFNIVMDIFLIMKIGPIGAVIATVLTMVFLVILQLINIKNILKIKFSETFPWFNWIKSIIVSLMISGSLYILYDITSSGVFVGLLFMFFSFVLSFFILSYMVNNEVLNYIVYVLKKLTRK